MAEGRDKIFMNGCHPDFNTKFNIPGPGLYPIKMPKTNIGVKFGKSLPSIFHNNQVPGPGQYPVPPVISETGKYVVSRFRNAPVPKIHLLKADGTQHSRFIYTASRKQLTKQLKRLLQATTPTSTESTTKASTASASCATRLVGSSGQPRE